MSIWFEKVKVETLHHIRKAKWQAVFTICFPPLASTSNFLSASTSDFLLQAPSSPSWQPQSQWLPIPWTWTPLVACPSKNYMCSNANFHLKCQGLGLIPIRVSWVACLSKHCSCFHLKRQMTNLLRGFRQLSMQTQSRQAFQSRLLHDFGKHAGFG